MFFRGVVEAWRQVPIGALVDFASMTAELGPTDKIQLRDVPLGFNFL